MLPAFTDGSVDVNIVSSKSKHNTLIIDRSDLAETYGLYCLFLFQVLSYFLPFAVTLIRLLVFLVIVSQDVQE